VYDDPSTGSVAERARGYLDVNCGSCHNPEGPAKQTGLYLTAHETNPTRLGLCKSPLAAGSGTGGFLWGIKPGFPDESILPFRMSSIEPGIAMPELGRKRVHEEALALIRQWIAEMPGDCDPN
jgi:hypothetical protein